MYIEMCKLVVSWKFTLYNVHVYISTLFMIKVEYTHQLNLMSVILDFTFIKQIKISPLC